ncbi:glycosyltransferase [Pseudoclavibacter sp. RFBA6]|uniref:glycosyltransferase n=1 Tax=Pseudoclavibacter sp. RFBA6 TaxID=2080573 RepID=UPI0015E23B24|nr:glycosyltransferase [Pseudoclavibacter sp. RFBA6]
MIAEDLTLVIVGYKHEEYVAKLLETVEYQTLSPARIILIDDDPAGLTASAAEEFLANSDLQVEVRANATNLGLCANLNAALADIDTDFYAYISADDWMLPTRFERQLSVARAADSRVAVIYSNALRVDEHDVELEKDFKSAYLWPEHRSGKVYLQMSDYNWLPAPSVLLRTASVRDLGGYDPDLFFEDHDLWLRLAREHEFECVDEPLVAFRELGSSLGHQAFQDQSPRFVVAYLQILAKHLGFSPEIDEMIAPKCWTLAIRLWRLEGPSKRVVAYLTQTRRGADNAIVARAYGLLARCGVSYSAVERIRSLTAFGR